MCYDELPVSDHNSTVNSLGDSEANLNTEIVTEPSSADQLEDGLVWEKAQMDKWGRKLRKCSCCLKIISVLFMAMSAWALVFPPKLEHMREHFMHRQEFGSHEFGRHGGRDQRPFHENGPGPRRGGRQHEGDFRPHPEGDIKRQNKGGRGGRHLEHDSDFFVVKKNVIDAKPVETKQQPGHTFTRQDKHEGRPHGSGQGEHYRVDKLTLQERRVSRLITRGAFLSFFMWLLVFVAACVGKRASWMRQQNRWIGCTFKKSVCLLIFASIVGVFGLITKRQVMGEMMHFKRALEYESQH